MGLTRMVMAAWIIGWLALVVGCGGRDPLGRKAISGKVTMDGSPVVQGSIDFQPIQGVTSSGGLIANGSYSIPQDKGLPPGKYRVAIHASDPGMAELKAGGMPGDDTGSQPKELVPPQWNTKSQHSIEVTDAGPTEFHFEIDTKKKS